ncbi:MAG TPA: DnaB-like helicase C-terminal domain-containing protein, partial [Gemmatimonadaceae bacterium]|nr:DnaB-like helicase C-terminal domain-containing protein [Gemmatimonadaceae bacterium]
MDSAADGSPLGDAVGSGFPSIDKILGGGLRRGDLVVLGGDVGSGKSALALAIALRAASAHRTLFLSGEMPPERIHERALAIEGRATIDELRLGKLDDVTRA